MHKRGIQPTCQTNGTNVFNQRGLDRTRAESSSESRLNNWQLSWRRCPSLGSDAHHSRIQSFHTMKLLAQVRNEQSDRPDSRILSRRQSEAGREVNWGFLHFQWFPAHSHSLHLGHVLFFDPNPKEATRVSYLNRSRPPVII